MVVEAGAARGCRAMAAVPQSSLAVPATLHASLLGSGASYPGTAASAASPRRRCSSSVISGTLPNLVPRLLGTVTIAVRAGVIGSDETPAVRSGLALPGFFAVTMAGIASAAGFGFRFLGGRL